MKHLSRSVVVIVAAAAFVGFTPTLSRAAAVSPNQLTQAGWTCIEPGRYPTLLLCFSPGVGLPPLPGTPGFADRLPSYENLVFDRATGAFLGTQHALRPDIYEQGKPPCTQQQGGEYIYNPFNDLWICNRLSVDIRP